MAKKKPTKKGASARSDAGADEELAEIAQMLGLPEGTVSSRLSRARKKLEVLLKEEATGE